MIEFKDLTKKYGEKLALDLLNLTIEDGEIFGLIGHNGAGKSTTIKSLVSVIDPTSGEIIVDGLNLEEHREEVKKRIGYVSDSPDLFLKLTAMEFWKFLAAIYEVEDNLFQTRVKELTDIMDLHELESPLEEFSHGMRQKAFIIGALLSNPDIWVLDEPMTGLDPQSSFNLKEMMRRHAEDGKTVLFSTHVLEVAEKLCHRIGILKNGKLIFLGTLEELKDKNPGKNLETIYLEMIKVYDEEHQNEGS